MTRLSALAALPLLIAAAPGHAQDARAAIDEAAMAWESAFNAADGKGVAELYTEDAALFPPGAERVDGKAAIAEFWQGAIDSGLADADLETVEVVEAGDLAYEVGNVSLSAPIADGERVPVSGKYIVVWQHEGDGAWRMHRDIWNLNPTPVE